MDVLVEEGIGKGSRLQHDHKSKLEVIKNVERGEPKRNIIHL